MLDTCEFCLNCEEKETEFICELDKDPESCDNDFEFNVNQLF